MEKKKITREKKQTHSRVKIENPKGTSVIPPWGARSGSGRLLRPTPMPAGLVKEESAAQAQYCTIISKDKPPRLYDRPHPRRSVFASLALRRTQSEAAGAAPRGCCSPAGCTSGFLQPRGELAPSSSPTHRPGPVSAHHAMSHPPPEPQHSPTVQGAGTAIISIFCWSGQTSVNSTAEMIKCVPCSPAMKDSGVKSCRRGLLLAKFKISLTHKGQVELF